MDQWVPISHLGDGNESISNGFKAGCELVHCFSYANIANLTHLVNQQFIKVSHLPLT